MSDLDIRVGDKIRFDYGEGNRNNRLYHVRAIVDDQYVLRHWSRSKRRWIYTIESLYFFQLSVQYLTIER